MLGDTAVAVNPEMNGTRAGWEKSAVAVMNREIPIIADAMVDREFGTGAVKITPAHDPNDSSRRRHKLAEIDVMTDDGKMTRRRGPTQYDRFEARKRLLRIEALGLLEKITEHTSAIGLCEGARPLSSRALRRNGSAR